MSNNTARFYVGLDVSKKSIEIHVLSGNGESGRSCRINNGAEALELFCQNFKEPQNVLMALESGPDSPWLSELLVKRGFQVAVGNARKLELIWKNNDKSDCHDAELLARQARNDLKLFAPIQHQTSDSRADLAVIKMREIAVSCRTKMINSVRGMLRAFGVSTDEVTVDKFTAQVVALIPKTLRPALKGIVKEIRLLQLTIKNYDQQIAKLCCKYPDTKKVDQISGVGPQTSLAFVLILGSTERFTSGGGVGKYLGLTPRRDQSGEVDKQLHITKEGNQ
jgi:transposase